jgi:DTW domain-containing protein YfiP
VNEELRVGVRVAENHKNRAETVREPRLLCHGCERPLLAWVRTGETEGSSPIAVAGTCFCDRITILPTRTRILMLQHPREHHVAIGTARMAHRALPNSRLRVGTHFAEDPGVLAALADSPATYVLFPGPGAVPVEQLPRDRALTLVVLDGTWSQARKLLRLNPSIAALPRVAFRPLKPSAYVIRKEPADFCVSTIEALAEVLGVLEPEGGRFARLLDPFHAMVDRQLWFQTEVRSSRHHFTRRASLGCVAASTGICRASADSSQRSVEPNRVAASSSRLCPVATTGNPPSIAVRFMM